MLVSQTFAHVALSHVHLQPDNFSPSGGSLPCSLSQPHHGLLGATLYAPEASVSSALEVLVVQI